MVHVEIEQSSGFCFGVRNAIQKAEQFLNNEHKLYCLGEIVHNEVEVERLKNSGLEVINTIDSLQNCKMLIRAHGEPPTTYLKAKQSDIEIIDATCPIVLKLQNKIKNGYEQMSQCGGSVVIYGKPGHAEVIGLEGQTKNSAVIINSDADLYKINFSKPVRLYSQTTQDLDNYNKLAEKIKIRMQQAMQIKDVDFIYYDTICRQVSSRAANLIDFVKKFEMIMFVSSRKSSNGMILFNLCKANNNNTILISDIDEINRKMVENVNSIGICGATSTPYWLMENCKNKILEYFK